MENTAQTAGRSTDEGDSGRFHLIYVSEVVRWFIRCMVLISYSKSSSSLHNNKYFLSKVPELHAS